MNDYDLLDNIDAIKSRCLDGEDIVNAIYDAFSDDNEDFDLDAYEDAPAFAYELTTNGFNFDNSDAAFIKVIIHAHNKDEADDLISNATSYAREDWNDEND